MSFDDSLIKVLLSKLELLLNFTNLQADLINEGYGDDLQSALRTLDKHLITMDNVSYCGHWADNGPTLGRHWADNEPTINRH